MSSIVEIILKGTDKASAVFKDTEKSAKGFKDVLTGIGAAGVGIAAVGATMKKAFDLGREGAVIAQTGESFDFLMKKVGAAPDLMDQLTAASHGTISAFELQSSTMTLLAGASGELGTSLANATPRLMEIAKAANKLNPALGSTAFMYESIATGVKRAQPLILDNLGLTLKVGEANEAYAESIGKTVEEMTSQDKAMAILNATLEAGDTLIAQVGGTTDAATDSFDQLDVSMKEIVDAFKKGLAPSLKDAAAGLLLIINHTKTLKDILKTHAQEVWETADSYEAFATEIERVEKANMDLIPGAQDAAEILEFFGLVTLENTSILDNYNEVLFAQSRVTGEATFSSDMHRESIASLVPVIEEAGEAAYDFSEILIGGASAADRAREASKKFLDGIDRDLASPIDNFVKDIQWFLDTGGKFEAAWARIQALAATAPEKALGLAQELLVMIEDSRVELNMTTGDEAAQNIKDTLGVELWEAHQMIAGTDGIGESMAGLGQINIDLTNLENMQLYTMRILSDLRQIRSGDFSPGPIRVNVVGSGGGGGGGGGTGQQEDSGGGGGTTTTPSGGGTGQQQYFNIYNSSEVDAEEMIERLATRMMEN